MKLSFVEKIKKEHDLKKIEVYAGVRYWIDCDYSTDNGKTWVNCNELDDTDEESERIKGLTPNVEKHNGETYKYLEGDYLHLTIDIDEGKVVNWPKGFCLRTNYKICDDGLYQIIDDKGEVVWDSVESGYYYVPDFLELEDEGFGDYMYINIDGEGNIEHWDLAKERIAELLEREDD